MNFTANSRKFALALILSSLVFIGLLVFPLIYIVKKNILPSVDSGFAGEARLWRSEAIELRGKVNNLSAPIFNTAGTRLLYIAKSTDKQANLRLWEQGSGETSLTPSNLSVVGEPALSGSGRRALFFAQEIFAPEISKDVASEAPHGEAYSLFLWEEGIGVEKLLAVSFWGEWQLRLSANGARALLFPKEGKFIAKGLSQIHDGEFTEPLLLTFTGYSANSRLRERTPENIMAFLLQPLGRSNQALATNISNEDCKLLTADRVGPTTTLLTKQYQINPRFVVDDVDGDRGSDLLVFSSNEEKPLWRAYTLSGMDGAVSGVAGAMGKTESWRVGGSGGVLGMVPVPGDYNRDGVLDLATFTPEFQPGGRYAGNWLIYLSRSLAQVLPGNQLTFYWGNGNARPVPADYDGDGGTDIAVFQPESGSWLILYSGTGFNMAKGLLFEKGYGEQIVWGQAGDVLVPGDYDGNGRADLGVVREVTQAEGSKLLWSIRLLSDSVMPNLKAEAEKKPLQIIFGRAGDIPVPADYDGDGKMDLSVYRHNQDGGGGSWIVRYAADTKIQEFAWSAPNAQPLVADYDADGRADMAFFSPKEEVRWWIRNSRFSPVLHELFHWCPPFVSRYSWGLEDEYPVQLLLRKVQRTADGFN